LFPASGGRGVGMMNSAKKPGANMASASMGLTDALNILIQGYIKGWLTHLG